MYSAVVIVVILALLSNAFAFSPMKSSSVVRRSAVSMSMTNVPVDVLTGMLSLLSL